MTEYRIRETCEIKSQQEIKLLHPNTSFPAVWTSEICDGLGIDAILKTPQPQPSSTVKQVIRNGVVQDTLRNWVEAWAEVDKFSDIPDGLTKEEQEAEYLALKAVTAIATKKAELKILFESKMNRPVVDTGLGFSVDGGRDDLENFKTGLKRGFWFARDVDNVMHLDLSEADMQQIVTKIEDNGMALYQHKWELEALIDVSVDTDIHSGWPDSLG